MPVVQQGAYSYESWQSLTSKKDKVAKEKAKADPSGGIMDMMKDMYGFTKKSHAACIL